MATRVLFVINSLQTGGAERMLGNLVRGLSADYQPLVAALMGGRSEIGDDLERAGVDVRYLNLEGVPTLATGTRDLIRLHRSFKPDVVSTWMYHSDLIGGIAAKVAGGSAVCWGMHNSTLEPNAARRLTRSLARVNARVSWRLPSAIICCSEASRALHIGMGYDARKFVTIPNGFDVEGYRPDVSARASVRAECGIPAGTPLVGLIARWHPQKNHRGFLEAAATLRRRMPGVHYLLAGTDLTRDNRELSQMLEETDLGDRVHLLGERTDMPRLFAALDVATLSSISGEAFPMVLGEAMACGTPCVATDIGDSALIIGDTGRVVAPNDPVALAGAWEAVLTLSPEERAAVSERARARIAENFSIGSVRRKYETVFASVAA